MRRHPLAAAGTGLAAAALIAASVLPGTTATAATKSPSGAKAVGGFKHIVVIYEENHSFDNLYGGWGKVGDRKVNGRSKASPAKTQQIAQDGHVYGCLMQNDVNLTSPPLAATCTDATPGTPGGPFNSHFTNGFFA